MNKATLVKFKLTFSGQVLEFEKINQVKHYVRHHRAIGNYTLHKMIGGVWVLWDLYRNVRV